MTNDNNKEKNLLYITHSAELLVWLIIILVIVAVSTITYIVKEKNDTNDYTIFMPDVDGLIVGSPVRMMGVEVGHVNKIKPVKSNVYVKFIITAPEITIPQGTVATVEFSGMAGSKSLELYLPTEKTYIDSSVPLLTVEPPKRLHDAFGLLNDMFKRLGNMIYTSSHFGHELNSIKDKSINGKSEEDISKFLQYSNKIIDDSTKRMEDLGRKLNDEKSRRSKKK